MKFNIIIYYRFSELAKLNNQPKRKGLELKSPRFRDCDKVADCLLHTVAATKVAATFIYLLKQLSGAWSAVTAVKLV